MMNNASPNIINLKYLLFVAIFRKLLSTSVLILIGINMNLFVYKNDKCYLRDIMVTRVLGTHIRIHVHGCGNETY